MLAIQPVLSGELGWHVVTRSYRREPRGSIEVARFLMLSICWLPDLGIILDMIAFTMEINIHPGNQLSFSKSASLRTDGLRTGHVSRLGFEIGWRSLKETGSQDLTPDKNDFI